MSKLSVDKGAESCVVTVCGGGNAAHTAAGMYSHHGATVNLFLSLERESEAWNAAKQDGITVYRQQEKDHYTGTCWGLHTCMPATSHMRLLLFAHTGTVHTASTNPADVIPQANLILIIVPAFAHKPILEYVASM